MGGWMLSALTAEALIRDRGRRIANAERAGEGAERVRGGCVRCSSTPQRTCQLAGNGLAAWASSQNCGAIVAGRDRRASVLTRG